MAAVRGLFRGDFSSLTSVNVPETLLCGRSVCTECGCSRLQKGFGRRGWSSLEGSKRMERQNLVGTEKNSLPSSTSKNIKESNGVGGVPQGLSLRTVKGGRTSFSKAAQRYEQTIEK